MLNRNYLDGIIAVGEFLFVMAAGDYSRGGDLLKADLDEYQHFRNEECIRKMLQPVACNGPSGLNTVGARRTLIDMAWYAGDEPEITQSIYWSEAAIKKMCEPTGHGHRIFINQTSLDKLACML